MDEHRRDRLAVWTPLLFSLILILGMALGFGLRDTLRNKRDLGTSVTRNDRIEEIIDLIKDKYVDTINSNLLYKDAISGILKSLDPHTIYIPADQLQSVNDDLEGGFSGIGVEFSIVRDTIEVTSVIENGPAGNAGVEIGDQLIKVGDTLVAGNNITAERITHLLKGKQHSNVYVTLKRSANGVFKQLPITRDIIPVHSVEASIMLDEATGFIKINRFSATTYSEFSKALNDLIQRGAKQLIVDVRENPGGYLDAVTAILDDLLDGNKLLVYTKGVHTYKTEYKTGDKGVFEKGRLAILVDESSASASEILAGAIQDWDRGVIIGRRTFGKGLVQEQYEMPDGAALRLTVAKYYTPSGRSIQRSFANGREAYMEAYQKRFEDGELTSKDTTGPADTTSFYTANHRLVYGGGGIKPDVYVPYDTSLMSGVLMDMIFSQELKTAIWDYFIHNRHTLKYRNIIDLNERFNGQEQVIAGYLNMLGNETRKAAQQILSKPVNNEYLKLQIKAQMARFLFHDDGYYAVSTKHDEVVNKALDVLNSSDYSKIISGKGR
jgi:carboxyl-terminal processing protease